MKISKWTLGLAALGLVSLTSVQADEAKTTALNTALSSTVLSGYVDTAAIWSPGTGNGAAYAFGGGKADGFNVNAVDIRLEKPLGDEQYAAGYVAELTYGPDATTPTAPIRQAYISLRVPVGTGLNLKVGQFDNILGYEVNDSYKNPNYTRSYGYSMEPTEETGVLGEYKFTDAIDLQAGFANTVTTFGGINTKSATETKKAVLSLLTLTAPSSWGFASGDSLAIGCDYGPGSSAFAGGRDKTEFYAGLSLNTGVKDLTVGLSYDSVDHLETTAFGAGARNGNYASAYAAYVSYKWSEKLTSNFRAEYANFGSSLVNGVFPAVPFSKVIALTGTVQYSLWDNVISRLEVRWDHQADGAGNAYAGTDNGGTATKRNEVIVAANVIYKF